MTTQSTLPRDDRSGFTLIELLVVAVAGMILLAGVFQVLLTNQKIYTARDLETRGRQSQLAGLDILFSELREISPSGGDVVGMGSNWITLRAQRKFGVACAVDNGAGTVTVFRMGEYFEASDSVFVFADGDVNTASDDTWLLGRVTSVDTTATCDGSAAQELSVPGMAGLMAVDSVRTGAPVRGFEVFKYSIAADGGQWYLTRQVSGYASSPVAGPLLSPSESGLAFTYLDSIGNTTTQPDEVAQIQVMVKTGADVLDSRGEVIRDSLAAVISLRN